MKVLVISLAVLCFVAWNVQARYNRFNPGIPPRSTGPTFPNPPRQPMSRFRRETPEEPQGFSIRQAMQSLSNRDSLSFDIDGPRDELTPNYSWIFRRELPEEREAEEATVQL